MIDKDPHSLTSQLEDLSQVEKYVMSDEDYDKLPNTMRKFLTNLRDNNPELFTKKNLVTDPEYQKDIADTYSVGDRCLILADEERGEVTYIGKIPDLGIGYYVGVRTDLPVGINDGR